MNAIMGVQGHRMSSLPIARFCGPAPRLSSIGAGRAAAQSSAFHALCADMPDAQAKLFRLTPEEAAELTSWKRPPDVDVGHGKILRYADAEKEGRVALNAKGAYVDPDSPDAVTIGHPDFWWIVEIRWMRIAYVPDLKRSEWTVDEGVESLQLHAYGLAIAGKYDCDAYVVGLWAAIEGLWQWSEIIDLMSAKAQDYAKRVVAAALNTSSDYARGSHCRGCYGRARCPAWLMPPELIETGLKPLTAGGELTDESALKLLLAYQRYVDTAKIVKESLEAYAVQNRGIADKNSGKRWLPVLTRGRESTSVEAVRKAFGDEASKVIKQGVPYQSFRWVNDR